MEASLNMAEGEVKGRFMVDADASVRQKVAGLFAELVGKRAERLDASRAAVEAEAAIAAALEGEHGVERAHDIGFHLADWGADAAFLVALHLFPERFTREEIGAGVAALLSHAPNHVAAAAHLAGEPVQDIFGVGVLGAGRAS